ncbi:hypothetical protein BNJ_00269 [Kaumoebavirus]|uniref:hypothetical protein n=1 Tax=Kaumoebavirus TaxID=1859492 RepID=UPI0009C2F86B|nr:hypothetical protein BNJ_00269 [Kaumoebavirus]ARA72093.1 hypothetical protein BNJ_00269 [Kaumoebavirus]
MSRKIHVKSYTNSHGTKVKAYTRTVPSKSSSVKVKGYYNSHGTYVKGYTRKLPSHSSRVAASRIWITTYGFSLPSLAEPVEEKLEQVPEKIDECKLKNPGALKPEMFCPISQSLMEEPTRTPCNHVFDKHCIEKWLESHDTCPICRTKLSANDLKTADDIAKLIDELEFEGDLADEFSSLNI